MKEPYFSSSMLVPTFVMLWRLPVGIQPGPTFSRSSTSSMRRRVQYCHFAAFLGEVERYRTPDYAYILKTGQVIEMADSSLKDILEVISSAELHP